jgi:hypothetical protein
MGSPACETGLKRKDQVCDELTLDNALNITPHIFSKDATGQLVRCPTARVRMPIHYGQGLALGSLGRCPPEAERNSQRCAW